MSTRLSAAPAIVRDEEIFEQQESVGAWLQAWRRLRKNRMATASLVVIALLYLVAIFSPLIARYDPTMAHFDAITVPPAWMAGGSWAYPLGTDGVGRD